MKLTASLVLYNTPSSYTDRITRSFDGLDLTLFVIDNSSSPTIFHQRENSLKIVYIHGHGNIGYGRAHNIAMRKAIEMEADYHIVVNPDIYFDMRAIEHLINYMDSHPTVGAIMPKIIYPDGSPQYLCKLLPTPMDLIGRRFIPFKKYVAQRNYRYELHASGYDKIMNVPCLSGCFMFLRVKALKEVGLFDENIFMYVEDFDLYRRLHSKYETLFYPEVTIIHEHAKGSYKSMKMLIAHIRSAIYYFNKWGWLFDKQRKLYNSRILDKIDNSEVNFSQD